jgi:putative ABC transport system permease protein
VPGAVVDRIAFVPGRVNGESALVLARTFLPGGPLPLDLQDGEPAAVLAGLRRGEVVLGTGLARRLGVARGGRVQLATRHGLRDCTVAGVAREFAAGGSALYLNWEQGRDLLGLTGPHALLVRLPDGDRGGTEAALREFCDRRRLLLESNAHLARQIDRLVARAAAALWALLALAFLVTGLGLLNTLTVNLAEQARDFDLLRTLGLTRRSVRRLVLVQALLLGGASQLPGLAAGLALAWFMRCVEPGGAGNTTVGPDPVVLIGTPVVALTVTLLASVGPARRASQGPGVGMSIVP